jgi:hypothetical protein
LENTGISQDPDSQPSGAPIADVPGDTLSTGQPVYWSWVRSEGLLLLYRKSKFLPRACTEADVVAVGSWMPAGWWTDEQIRRGEPVTCRGDWVVFDVSRLVSVGIIERNQTYCMNFRTLDGDWGMHGAYNTPGLEISSPIMIPAASGIENGRTFGFRVAGNKVEFTNEGLPTC